MSGTHHFTSGDGVKLAYRDEGEGVPLLCLAGLTRNGRDFDEVARDFGARARVIRLDTRGRGASAFDPDFLNYNLLREGQDALDLLDHLGIAKAAVLGTSRGGLISMVLALTGHRDRLMGVCLNDVGPIVGAEGLRAIMGYLGIRPPYPDLDAAGAATAQAMAGQFPGVTAERWTEQARRYYRQTPHGLELSYDPLLRQALIAQSAALPSGPADLWPAFDALHGLPLALIRGANSTLLEPSTMAEMQRRRPDMIAAEVPDRGHVPFLDEPQAQSVIAGFLDALA